MSIASTVNMAESRNIPTHRHPLFQLQNLPTEDGNIPRHHSTTSGPIHISPTSGATSLELFDLSGKKLMTSKNLETIDVSPFQTGIYLLKINTDKGSETHKIIKN